MIPIRTVGYTANISTRLPLIEVEVVYIVYFSNSCYELLFRRHPVQLFLTSATEPHCGHVKVDSGYGFVQSPDHNGVI